MCRKSFHSIGPDSAAARALLAALCLLAVEGCRQHTVDVTDAGTSADAAACPAAIPRSASPAGIGASDAVDTAVEKTLANQHVGGASVAVVRNGQIVFAKAYGSSQPTAATPINVDTPFLIASTSKTVTAVATMQLVERGKLTLDQDVNELLAPLHLTVRNPAFPDVPITVRMLMTHTSSIADASSEFDATFYTTGDAPLSLSRAT